MATSAAVRGASLLTNFWKAVEEEILAAGGTEEHLGLLVTKKMRPAIKRFAQDVVSGMDSAVRTFRDMIAAAKFDSTYGFADQPEKILGQMPHAVTRELELDHPGKTLTTQQVLDRYGESMASLSEFLDYIVRNPEVQRQTWMGIVWKDESGQFWFAYAGGGASRRSFHVGRDHPVGQWLDNYRFLRRK